VSENSKELGLIKKKIMIRWYKKVVLDDYVKFSGRARRSEYWYFQLMAFIFATIVIIIDSLTGLNIAPLPYGYLFFGYAFATLLPGLSVAVRRLHDIGKSGWYLLVGFIPIVGAIWILALLSQEGERGENDYGSDPKNDFEGSIKIV
jgi:uncharacterized membrane protein YhaH (DUF805 family)